MNTSTNKRQTLGLLVAAGITSMLVAGTAMAEDVVFKDPTGDDNGPGNYVYPTDAVYKKGSFDLTELEVIKKGDSVEFSTTVNSKLEDPWGMGVGFAVQMMFIYIDNAPGGHTAGLPGTNMQFAKGNEWDKVVILSPQKKARVVSEAKVKAADVLGDIVVPDITRGRNRTIKGKVPLSALGGDGNVESWGYQVIVQSNEGFPAEGDLLTRKVNEYEGQHRWGGGHDGDCDPHVMDIIGGPEVQYKQLAYECGDGGESKKIATVEMVRK